MSKGLNYISIDELSKLPAGKLFYAIYFSNRKIHSENYKAINSIFRSFLFIESYSFAAPLHNFQRLQLLQG